VDELLWSTDGANVVAVAEDEVWVWDWKDKGFKDGVSWPIPHRVSSIAGTKGLALASDGRTLAVTDGPWVRLLDMRVRPPKEVGKLRDEEDVAHLLYGTTVALHPIDMVLAIAGRDASPRLLNVSVDPPKEIQILPQDWGHVIDMAFSPDGKTLAVKDSKGMWLWDVAGQKKRMSAGGDDIKAISFAFSPDGQTFAVGRADSMVVLWEVASGRPRAEWKAADNGNIRSVAFSPDGRLLATLAYRELSVWAWGRKVWSTTLPAVGRAGVAWGPDSRHLAVGNTNGTVYVLRMPASPRDR
jgi:WD40 repeat protein